MSQQSHSLQFDHPNTAAYLVKSIYDEAPHYAILSGLNIALQSQQRSFDYSAFINTHFLYKAKVYNLRFKDDSFVSLAA
jgi:hypothetical protein